MQQYMPGMSNGGSIAARAGEVLTDSEIAAVCPSVFAETAHESRSDRFVPIPSGRLMQAMRAADFLPVFAQQARTRIKGKAEFTRHMIRFRHASLTDSDGHAIEAILNNANDGTSSYRLMAGVFRFLCLNGLYTGTMFDAVTIRHIGGDVVDQVRDGALRVLEQAPAINAAIADMRATVLTDAERVGMAEAAHLLRFPQAYEADEETGELVYHPHRAPAHALDLLRPRRSGDSGADVWSVFNVLQENGERGGQRGFIRGQNGRVRRATVREITGIDGKETFNRTLWDIAAAAVSAKRRG